MNKEFIPYEQALELKELGFNEPCLSYYEGESFSYDLVTMTSGDDYIIPAPLYQQAFRWFREKKILPLINAIDSWDSWSFSILAEDCMSPFFEMVHGDEYKSYEEAELACLKKLIEIIKNK